MPIILPKTSLNVTVTYYSTLSGIAFTSVRYTYYMEDLLHILKPEKQADGTYAIGGLLILYFYRLRTSMCKVYKIINEMGPVYLKKLFTQKKTPYESRAAVPVTVPNLEPLNLVRRA